MRRSKAAEANSPSNIMLILLVLHPVDLLTNSNSSRRPLFGDSQQRRYERSQDHEVSGKRRRHRKGAEPAEQAKGRQARKDQGCGARRRGQAPLR